MSRITNDNLASLRSHLLSRVVGQTTAVDRLCAAVWRSELAFHDPDRPRGSFLFLGSTGVGKTELSLALAEFLCGGRDHITRFDMSEYMDKSAISRFIGNVDGFQGQLQQAFDRVGEDQVFLFDEMEKAHPEILNVFLQILDAARFTTANGSVLNFKKSFVIMTSNVGSSKILNGKLLKVQIERSVKSELFSAFRPEFINRFDDIVIFEQLTMDIVRQILDLRLSDTLKRFKERGFFINITQPVKDFILVDGFNRKLGARPLKRSIVSNLVDPLTENIINNMLNPGEYVAQMKIVNGVQRCVFSAPIGVTETMIAA